MSDDREPLYAIVARIDANVQALAERAHEDRNALRAVEVRADKLESFKDRALAVIAGVGFLLSMLKDTISGAVAHALNLH